MRKAIFAAIFALLFIGCNNTTNSSRPVAPTPVQPQPVPPQPIPEPEPGAPDVGTGSVSANLDCGVGTIKVDYVFKSDSTIDSDSFYIVHSINGERYGISYPSVSGNGSISRVEETIFVPANGTDSTIIHTITVNYMSAGLNKFQTFIVKQPSCDVDMNTTAYMKVDVK